MATQPTYSDFHRLIWVCGIIGAMGGACGIFYGIVKWMVAVYRKFEQILTNLGSIQDVAVLSSNTAKVVADTKSSVDLIQTNHLVHLNDAMEKLVESNETLVALTQDVRDGIIKLVDRSDRP